MPQKMIQSIYHFHSKEGNTMNKIYKVIWSKAKHTYVVASEIAKGHTKGETTGRGLKKLAAAMLVAAALMGPNFAWAADIVKVEPAADTASTTAVEVYTKEGAEKEISTLSTLIGNNATQIGNNATQIGNNATNIKSNTDKISKLESAVGDDDSGLKKDVNDLKTMVGDSNGGLVKDVADSKTAIDNEVAVRQSADKQLQTNIDNEAAAREAEDARLNSEIVKTNTSLNEAASNLSKLNDTVAKGFEDLKTEDKTLQTNIENEAATRESADSALDSRTSALEAKTGSLNRVAVANSTSINESMTYKGNQYSATLQVNGSGAQIGVVNNSVAGLANDGGTAYTEYRARTGAILSKATNDISSTSSNGQVVDTAGDTTGEYSQAATKSTGTTFTYSNDGGKTSSSTTIKGNSVSTGTVSATAGITDETTKDGKSVIASQTVGQNLNALDERITNVKEYLEKQTSDTYVSKDDAAVQDGAIVKADKTIGENVTNLDAALAKETADRLGADKAQDKVIEQVNQNMVDGFNTINKNMADGFTALNQADANELAGRMAADTKLVEAVNSGVSLSNDNVLQKNTTTIDAQGNVTTSKTDANEMILNKGKDNQITLNKKGIKVGTNSTVMDKDGVYTGGDTFDAAKAAMSSDGQIKGANGKFTVDASGNTTVTSLDAGTGTIQTKGDLYAKDATFSGDITAKDATLSGDLSAKDGTFSGDLSAKDGTFSGDVSAKDVTATGTLQGAEVTDGTATLKQGKLTGVKDIETEALHVNGDANVTGKMTTKDLEVTGEFNANTLKSRLDENNYTEIHGGNVTSKNLKVDKGVTRTSESSFDENGREEYVTDNDSRATVKVGANEISQTLDDKRDNPKNAASRVLSQNTNNKYEITDSVVEGNQSNVENRTADTTDSQISFKDDSGKVLNKSYITQNLKKVLMGVEEGDNKTTIEQDANNITNTAKNGTITNDAGKLVNTASESVTTQIGDGSEVQSVMNGDGIANKATGKSITNDAATITNTGTTSVTNQVGNNKVLVDTTHVQSAFGDTIYTTWDESGITNNATDKTVATNAKNIQNTATGDISNIASNGTISNEAKTISNKADEALTNDAKTITNTASESVTTQIGDGSEVQSVMNGDGIANKATGKSITNDAATITNTGTTSVTNQVGNNKVLVDTTHVQSAFGDTIYTTWDESGITNNATDKTVATNAKNIQNTATGDITNTAEKGTITNKAQNLVNDASDSITDKVGENVERTMTTNKISESVKDGTKSNSFSKTAEKDINIITDGTKTSTLSQLANSVNTSLKEVKEVDGEGKTTKSLSNVKTVSEDTTKITDTTSGAFSSSSQKADSITSTVKNENGSNVATEKALSSESKLTSGSSVIDVLKSFDDAANPAITSSVTDGTNNSEVKQTASEVATSAKDISNTATDKIISQIGDGSKVKSEMTADGITNTAKGGTIYNKSKDILNEASGDIINWADGEIGNVATKITNITGDNTVTSDTNGTTFENKAHSKAIEEGSVTKTTISGNTLETGKATMDYAEVMKDLGVHGNATVDGNTTLGTDRNDTLTVNSTSTFKEKVTMENDLNVKSEVLVNEGDKNQVRINKNGITVGLNSTVVDSDGVYVGGHTFEAAKAGMDIDGKLKAADGKFQVDTEGNVSAVSYTVKDTNIKIDNTGINAGGTNVTGLAPADISHAGSTDAVSGGQLYETNTRVSGLETRMGTVETRVDKLDNKIDKVGANAAAMANLHPLEFDEDSKWNIAAAVGSSGSETASAVGVFYRPNENVMVNASAAMGTGENMFGGGVSLRLGHGGNKAKEAQMKAAAAENKELRAKVDDLTARMDALLSVLNPNMSKDFPDVPENHWAYEAVSRLAGNGIVEGYEDGKYHGERQMTRYEMAEIIYNALSKGAKAEKKLVEEFRPELQAMAAQKKA